MLNFEVLLGVFWKPFCKQIQTDSQKGPNGGHFVRPADDGKRFSSVGRCMGEPEAFVFVLEGGFEGGDGSRFCQIGGRRMTGSALQRWELPGHSLFEERGGV